MRIQRMLPLPLPLLLLALAASVTLAAIDSKDNKSSPIISPDQHNVINLSLQTETNNNNINGNRSSSSDTNVNFDLTRRQRLRDALNVFDLSLLAPQWPRLEATRMLSVNCTKDMRSYLHGLTDATMWAVKSKYKRHK